MQKKLSFKKIVQATTKIKMAIVEIEIESKKRNENG
jgi:hypothetical protein